MDKKRNCGVMLFISIVVHSLLALLPWQEPRQEKSRPLAVSSTPASPISVVDASQLPTLSASESQPLPASPSPPAPDTSIVETNDIPSDESSLEAVPSSDAVPATTPTAAPATPNPITPGNEAQIAADWEYLVGYLENQSDGFDSYELIEILEDFGIPGQVNQFFDENGDSKIHVFDFGHFTTQTPEQVESLVMPELTSSTDFNLQRQESFRGAGLAYQLSQGGMLRYLIIVALNEGNGSVLMFSESLPELEP